MTVLTRTLRQSLVQGYSDSIQLREVDALGILVTLPHTLEDGTPVQLMVSDQGDLTAVTDRGLVADHLDMFGVDLSRERVAASWAAIRGAIGFAPALDADDWDLSALGEPHQMAALVQAVADAAIRADGLRVLASGFAPRTFGSEVVRTVGSRVTVVPRAPLPDRLGAHRHVTCSFGMRDIHYVQALGASSKERRVTNFDKTRSMFLASTAPRDRRIAVLQGTPKRWEKWQLDGLDEVGIVAFQSDLERIVDEVAAQEAQAS